MSFSLNYDKDMDCVVLVFDGTVNLEVIREAAPQAARLCREAGCRRILNDMHAARLDLNLTDIFESPGIMDKSNLSRSVMRALVLPPGFKDARFLETVTRNRGHHIKVFTDRLKAQEWLVKTEMTT